MCDGHMAFHTIVDTNPLVLRLDSIWLEKPVKKADYRSLLSFVIFVQVNIYHTGNRLVAECRRIVSVHD